MSMQIVGHAIWYRYTSEYDDIEWKLSIWSYSNPIHITKNYKSSTDLYARNDDRMFINTKKK